MAIRTLSTLKLALAATLLSASTQATELAVKHLSEAIQFQTVSHQQRDHIDLTEFARFTRYLEQTYSVAFERLEVEKIAEHSLLMTWQGSNAELKPVLLDAHYDVVPIEPGTENEWHYPPFEGKIADGFLWGRGAIDDKSTVIATLEALETLVEDGFVPERTLIFSFAHDEEIGGAQGAANIAKHLAAKGVELEFMVGEGGLVVEDNPMLPGKSMAMIALAEKTYVTLTLKATGDGGHSSMPVANNAVINLSRAVTALHDNPFDPELVSPMTDMLNVLGKEVGGFNGWMMRNQWISAPILASVMSEDPATNPQVRSTTAVTMFDAGIKENVISQKAEAKVNFRLLPGYTPEQLVEDVKAIIDDESIEIESDAWKKSPPVADIHGHGYDKVKTSIETVLPETITVPGMLTATTDSPHYAELAPNIYRFHPFTLSMSDTKSIHGTNERISIESIHTSVKLSTELIKAVSKP
ncbi:MAG: M20/M25/M40 family metallo-hydrolase [Cellvibrionaceae bacterium]